MNGKAMVCAMSAAILGVFGSSAEAAQTPAKAVESSKILIAYYSWSPAGNTRYAAGQIQKATGGTLFEIKPVKPYSTDYNACLKEAKKDIRGGVKPALASKADLSKYDVIFVGSPNWWGTMAPPVLTFLSSGNFKGKTVVPFFTNGGGGMQNCEKDIRKALPGVNVVKGMTFSGSSVKSADSQIAAFVKSAVSVKAAK